MREITLSHNTRVQVRKKRSRTLRLVVRADGSAVLTLPYFVSYETGFRFLQKKLFWIRKKKKELARRSVSLLGQGSQEEFRAKREDAYQMITERLQHWEKKHHFASGSERVTIRNQKTRWGSCSRNGRLSFNYRLILLPELLRDYVLVHELCHLREFNHSPGFWNLMETIIPDYQEHRRHLKAL